MAVTHLRPVQPTALDDSLARFIRQLQVVVEDIQFLNRTGQEVNYHQYPELTTRFYQCMVDPTGQWLPHSAQRLERAGFWVYKNDTHYVIQYQSIRIPIAPLQPQTRRFSHWHDHLVD